MRCAVIAFMTCVAALGGCAEFPQLDGTISAAQSDAPFPDLIPLAPIIARATAPSRAAPEGVEAALGARLANLRARAAGLRGPVISPADRTRMMRPRG